MLYIFPCIVALDMWSIVVSREGLIMPSTNKRIPSREAIERRAYEIYIERGSIEGHDVEDWLAAEEELMSRAEEVEAVRERVSDLRPAPLQKSVTAS
jgi:hypothetical protein